MSVPQELQALLGVARGRQQQPAALFDVPVIVEQIRKPTLYTFWGDWHLGAQGTDYERFENDLTQLMAGQALLDDQLKVVGMGDYIDGYLQAGGTPRNPHQILSPREQREAVASAWSAVKPLVVVQGDHDEWHSKSELQYDWLFDLAGELGTYYAQWGTRIDVHLPDREEPLPILARHRFKGSRATDVLRPHKNLHLELGPASVVALAHTHSYPGCYRAHAKRRSEGEFTAVQSGTYKLLDDYGKKLGFTGADYGVPAVLIDPSGHVTSFDHFEDGIDALL